MGFVLTDGHLWIKSSKIGKENGSALCYNGSKFRRVPKEDLSVRDNKWEVTLKKLQDGLRESGDIPLLALSEQLKEAFLEAQSEVVDIRDFCESCGRALCITDAQGCITYMNDAYVRATRLQIADALGKPEPYRESISVKVMEQKQTVVFGNDGSRVEQGGRMVSGVPIFDRDGKLRHIVITLDTEELIFQSYQELRRLTNQRRSVRILDGDEATQGLLGKDPAIRNIRNLIRKVAPTDATVLITGESGSGKEVVADCIYELSGRKGKPLVKINCAAIPPNLLEAELFGYEKGAFTGANTRKTGLFEVANHGTIFLDEIGDFPTELQPKLLRVLQQRELYRIGCSTPVKLDVRVIAATNADLKQKMQTGTFREDLYYRLSVFPISVPPLRERREDILGLAHYFLEVYSKKYKRAVTLSKEICHMLEKYDWPGNVREMQNVIEYYVICSEEANEMSPEQLACVLQLSRQEIPPHDEPGTARKEDEAPVNASKAPLFELRDNYERALILDALRRTDSARQAARMLGIFPSSLYRKCQKYGIQLNDLEK